MQQDKLAWAWFCHNEQGIHLLLQAPSKLHVY